MSGHQVRLAAGLSVCFVASSIHGQSPNVPAAEPTGPIAIVGATIHTASADPDLPPVIARGWILVRDGVIVDLGGSEQPMPALDPADWTIVDASGMHVCPGFHAMDTQLGLVESMAVRATDDRRETGDVTPEIVPAVAINPDTDLIPVARAGGILLASVVPEGGLVPGWCSTIRLDGWTPEELAVESKAGLLIAWPMMDPVRAAWVRRGEDSQRNRTREQLESLEKLFDDAAAWRAAREADADMALDRRLAAVAETLDGAKPIFVTCGSTSQVEAAIAFAARRGLRLVIVGGPGTLEVADLLAERDIPVIVDGVHRLPRHRHDRPFEPFELAGKLHTKGVRVAIATAEEPAHERNLPHQAATAAAHGLPTETALAAITRVPAEIVGIADRYGSLGPGRSATLLVLDGPPLEITSAPVAAYIDGRPIDLSSRQSRQREKYLEKYRRQGRLDNAAVPDP
ncbi:MAG: amidohydrolase family protein [Phycisphaerales bacterium]|jgi:imidazolonepropionase-like amidohydrolase